MSKSRRLDQELVHRQLFDSREKAQRAIIAGEIWVNGQRWDKASALCPETAAVEHRGNDRYVSRGAYKLEAALTGFGVNPKGLRCLDIGSSTRGFTDCLLQHGAASVTCIDVGEGQLHWKIRQDPRVIVKEGINARYLTAENFEAPFVAFDLIVTDVSFISLRLVLPQAFDLLKHTGDICALIKPQFEVGKDQVGKGGIVKDKELHQKVISDLELWSHDFPISSEGVLPSPLPGREGNQEFLWHLKKKR